MSQPRPRAAGPVTAAPRGLAVHGRLWPGATEPVVDDAVVVVDDRGVVAAYGPAGQVDLPDGIARIDGGWIGPALTDAHVHLAFGPPAEMVAGGVLGLRDLGAPTDQALALRSPGTEPATPVTAVAGPILTAPGGYPSRTWGARGFARFVASPGEADRAVATLAREGVDVVKLALEPAGGAPVPSALIAAAIVAAAHERGLAAVAHALTAEMVTRALDAGVDELVHTPTEHLPTHLVARLAMDRVPVVSTLHTLTAAGGADATGALANARALVGAGVPYVYGTDLGNDATSTGVDPVELDLLAEAGLGRGGALAAATVGAGGVAGLAGRVEPAVAYGRPARLVVLAGDPLVDGTHWRRPVAVVHGTDVLTAPTEAGT